MVIYVLIGGLGLVTGFLSGLLGIGGGIVMGLGASLAGGCNIGHGITGISTLAMSSVAATLFTILGCWTMTWVVYSSEARKAAAATLEQRRSA